MSKTKPVKKKKKAEKVVAVQEVEQPEQELSEEQVAELILELEKFQNSFLSKLARTEKFEVIPTADEDGNVLSEEQLTLIKRELNRLGLTTIYTFDIGTRFTALMCPSKNSKLLVGMISKGSEVH